MKTQKTIFTFCLILLYTTCQGQDTIRLKTGAEYTGWILEKSDYEVKYKVLDADDSPIVILNTKKIENIIFRDGQEMRLTPLRERDTLLGVRMDKRIGINMGIMYGIGGESVFYKVQGDYFVTPAINIEFAGMIDAESGVGGSIGMKYYFDPYSHQKTKVYAGLMYGVIWHELFLQIPVGVSFTGKKGFDLKVGLNGFLATSYEGYGIYSELLLGWRF